MTTVFNKFCPFTQKNCVKECQLYQNGHCALANSATALTVVTNKLANIEFDINRIQKKMP